MVASVSWRGPGADPFTPQRRHRRLLHLVFLSVWIAIFVVGCYSPRSDGLDVTADPRMLLPDLQPSRPTGLDTRRLPDGRRLLRFDTLLINNGPGPLEIAPRTSQCDADDAQADNAIAFQRIYYDVDGDGAFTRGSDRDYSDHLAGCFEYHPAHRHWHYSKLMRYDLYDLSSGGRRLLTQTKMGFCLLDTVPSNGVQRDISMRHYVGDGDDRSTLPCLRSTIQGLSPGWGDVYSLDTPGQHVDISSVDAGSYCLEFAVESSDVTGIGEEATDNNSAGTALEIQHSGDVRELGEC